MPYILKMVNFRMSIITTMRGFHLLILVFWLSYQSEAFYIDPRLYVVDNVKVNITCCPGKPLFLTPLVEEGKFKEAQRRSQVGPLKGVDTVSHAGFFTVNKTTNSNMYFWFWPAQVDPENAPLLLWLQGGPGSSSLFGMFVENGPYTITENLKLVKTPINWNIKYSMLYIDNPVGTGFSFTDKDEGYATNEVKVAEDLYSFLIQFFLVFSHLQKNPFYITGESYGGKYVPAIAYKIHMENLNTQCRTKVNLVGIAIGNGTPDPESMMPHYADFLFNIGMLDEKQRDFFYKQTMVAVHLIQQKKFREALVAMDILFSGKITNRTSFFYNATHTSYLYNFLLTKEPKEFGNFIRLLGKPEVRHAIHVGDLPFNGDTEVTLHLIDDILDTVKPWLTVLMEKYKVLMYSGQLDIILAVPLTEAFLMTIPWSGLDRYKNTDRMVWKVNESDQEVAGYVRQVDNFYQVIVRGGGHILPHDQPSRSFDMIDRFVSGRGFQ